MYDERCIALVSTSVQILQSSLKQMQSIALITAVTTDRRMPALIDDTLIGNTSTTLQDSWLQR
jgi:hypothetical protein